MIFGKWNPIPTLFACLLFGFLEALGVRLEGVELMWIGEVPVQIMQALPYVLTVVLLAGFIGKERLRSYRCSYSKRAKFLNLVSLLMRLV